LLDEGGADADAMDLIRTSALNASVRLKFARLAFGASGSVGASIDTGEAEKAVVDYVSADKKTEVKWSRSARDHSEEPGEIASESVPGRLWRNPARRRDRYRAGNA
jgi:hypothetical protein